MPAQRATLWYHHDNMVPSPAGDANTRTIWETEDGILIAYGTTVPANATANTYAPGCLFFHTDGSGLVDVVYVNVGTYASCNFDSLSAFTQQSHVADPAACAAMTATLTGVDTGTDMTAAQAATIVADLAALKTAVDANNAVIDSILASLETVGIHASA
jgi:hypothetical protein